MKEYNKINSQQWTQKMNKMRSCFAHTVAGLIFFMISAASHGVSLDQIKFSSLSGEQTQIKLVFSEPLSEAPLNFTIDNPARIAIDLPGVMLGLDQQTYSIGIGMAHSAHAVEAGGRARVVVNLIEAVPYSIKTQGEVVLVTVGGDSNSINNNASDSSNLATEVQKKQITERSIRNIDFRRGEAGEGRVIIRFSDPSTVVNLDQREGDIIVEFLGTKLPQKFDRTLDVIDFATPVKEIDARAKGSDTLIRITPATQDYDYLAYQVQNLYTLEFKPLSKEEAAQQAREKQLYHGQKISLNFQNIEVRAVLLLLADLTGFNLVVSDSVTGNVTLQLSNVPWDQALDIILKSRGLAMRESGNVIRIAPQEEVAARERLELESERQIEELAPLRTEFIRVNYANAEDMAALIRTEDNNLLSSRGTVSIDNRTNTLIVQDVVDSLKAIRSLISELDIPVRQVLIESRVVNAEENFAKDIGVRFGYSKNTGFGRQGLGAIVGGAQPGNVSDEDLGGSTAFNTDSNENLIVDLPANPSDAAGIALAVGRIGSYLLQLELSALIAEGRVEDIASPRVITANQTEAVIEQGVQIPFQEATSSGATAVSFQNATLRLRVTPQITPDDRVLMNLQVNQDSRGSPDVAGVPPINTRSVQTNVLVNNGETVVLGGIYSHTDRTSINRVPFFSELPYLGFLFKRESIENQKTELLVFITPKILKDNLTF